MIWNNASEFFAMGGYGLYVWGSYTVTAAWMLLEPWLVRRRLAQALRAVSAPAQQEPQ
jgi:heme exporter protein D